MSPGGASIGGRAQRGIALITAIVLVAIAAVIATAIGFNSAMSARRAAANFGVDQSLQIAEGAEALAAYALKLNSSATRRDSPDQEWAKPYGPVEIDSGVVLEAALEDQQGKFNINNLVKSDGTDDPIALAEFERLLALLGLEPKWAPLLVDWLDADFEPSSPDGAEDSVYLSQLPPYRTANIPVSSTSELLALPGFGRARYDRLAPYIAALPPGTAVNVCTASGIVLDAMTPGTTQSFSEDAERLAARRQSGCYPTLAEFSTTMTQQQYSQLPGRFAETSNYFRLRSWITIGTARFSLYSLMYRDGGQIRPILRTFGTE
ncbi:MAG: type II secretion system minor pseudopilin GspK [Steroidobacterales bacterium]